MPSEMLAAALPDETEADAQMKRIFHNQCTGCHTPGYPLQFKFDEAGWNKIINLMKAVANTGVYQGPNAKPNGIIEFNRKDLAAYLARARGPGESSMKFKDRPRPSGENAHVVWQTYDLPLNPDTGAGVLGSKYPVNDGYDWNLGTPSKLGQLPHDGAMGFDGNLYYTVNNPNPGVTVGKVDTKTGEVKYIKVERKDGRYAATAHGLTRDGNGDLWFDVDHGRRSLGKLEVATEKVSVYETPPPMSPLGGAVTLDVDGKGRVWASAPDGVVAFDPATEKFTDFKSILPFKNAKGTNSTNGNPLPWAQGPRRMGTDKNADVLWVGNSWGSSLARIDTKTGQTSIVPFPDPAYQPYHIAVDQNHNVWGNLWTADRIAKYDPFKGEWTMFDLPTRGTEIRHISLLEKDGVTKVTVPIYRDSKMGVMTLRSEADIAALKAQAK